MTWPLSRRCLLSGGAVMIGATATNHRAWAQVAWPTKRVRLAVGFTAGSATDVTGRLFAQKFGGAWGQGVDRVTKAEPDSHTPMWSGNAAKTVLPSLQSLSFDPLKDLVSIALRCRRSC